MLPMKMTPAFRYGKDTPWGGDALGRLFGKAIPDPHTGESLEVSALPGLASCDKDGRSLPELLALGGPAFRGTQVGEVFPLLLKLIDARERLSVQVHPNDAYAAAHEGGKLGKTEAWVILNAPAGAQLVYGIAPGATREDLRYAATQGRQIEDYLRYVTVRPGDTLYIPAGMVHAIGEGIVLYEIQQSSDVTYRFWDWDRRDAQGKARELHLNKALDVTDVSLQLQPLSPPRQKITGGFRTPLLRDGNFALDRLEVTGNMPLEESPQRFRLLTALCEGWMAYPGGALSLKPGDSVFIPADSPRIKLEMKGELLLASPPLG